MLQSYQYNANLDFLINQLAAENHDSVEADFDPSFDDDTKADLLNHEAEQ